MGSASKVPIGFSGCSAFDIPWVVPAFGLTDFAIISLRSHNIVQLIFSACFLSHAASIGAW